MEQLLMIRNNNPASPINFPEGYYMRPYQPGDGTAWCECCLGGHLGIDEAGEDVFRKKMLEDETVNPSNIFFLISPSGEIAGTVTYQYGKKDTGTIHMVAIKKEYQGLGLALPMNLYAVDKIVKDGKKGITLTTDDWRLPAIKSYLNAGFEPVYYMDGMEDRWKKVMEQLG